MIVVVGRTYEDAERWCRANSWRLAQPETFGLEIKLVSASAPAASVEGLRVHGVYETTDARAGKNYMRMREALTVALARTTGGLD